MSFFFFGGGGGELTEIVSATSFSILSMCWTSTGIATARPPWSSVISRATVVMVDCGIIRDYNHRISGERASTCCEFGFGGKGSVFIPVDSLLDETTTAPYLLAG